MSTKPLDGYVTATSKQGELDMTQDDDAYAFYADTSNVTSSGAGRRRKGPSLSSHVPIRFAPEVVMAVKVLAEADSVSVSTWIRNLVIRELRSRIPTQTVSSSAGMKLTISGLPGSHTKSTPTELVGAL